MTRRVPTTTRNTAGMIIDETRSLKQEIPKLTVKVRQAQRAQKRQRRQREPQKVTKKQVRWRVKRKKKKKLRQQKQSSLITPPQPRGDRIQKGSVCDSWFTV